MPEIPRFSSSVVAEPVQSRIGASQLVPSAVVEFGQQIQRSAGLLAQVEIRRHEALDQADASNLLVEAEIALENRQLELEESRDPRTHAQNMREQSQEVQREILAQAKNENVKQMIQPKLALLAGRQYIEARRKERTWTVEDSQASLMRYEDLLEQRIAKTTDQRDIDAIFKEMDEAWDERIPSLGAARVEAGKQAARRRMYEAIVLRDIRLDPKSALADLTAGKYENLESAAKERLINHAEASLVKLEGSRNQQRLERKREAEARYMRDLEAGRLNLNEVLANPDLDLGEREFFRKAAKEPQGKMDPATAVAIEDTISRAMASPSRDEQIALATEAKRAAQDSWVNKKNLDKETAMHQIRTADKIIRGEDPEKDSWYRLGDEDLKQMFGWKGGPIQEWLKPGGRETYMNIVKQVRKEAEANPNLRGQALLDRMMEIAKPLAIGYWMDQVAPTPAKQPEGKGPKIKSIKRMD